MHSCRRQQYEMGLLIRFRNFVHRNILIVVIIVLAIFLLVISAIQYYGARHEIRDRLENDVVSEIKIKTLKIRSMLSSVEATINGKISKAEQAIKTPSASYEFTRDIIEHSPMVVACALAFKENYFPNEGRLFEPYSARLPNGEIETSQLSGPNHDYTKNVFYQEAVKADSAYWSDPYMDTFGSNMLITTYTCPIVDRNGVTAAIMQVDISSDWLSSLLNEYTFYPSTYSFLVTAKGDLISGPKNGKVSDNQLAYAVKMINDSTVSRRIGNVEGIKIISFEDKERNEKALLYYKDVRGLSDWRIAMVNYESEVYDRLNKVNNKILFRMLIVLILFSIMIAKIVQNTRRLQEALIRDERISSELRVASIIQQEMLPNTDTPFPNRTDIDVCGKLNGAKEVDGDLFDFFVRDEKLFFCIGDVSGKGVPSSLVMAIVHSLFRAISSREGNPTRIVESINEFTCQGNESGMFVTFFLGVLDLPTGRLRYCNAGHDLPFILGEKVRRIKAKPNLPLSVISGYRYSLEEDQLLPGEMIFLYTDGITEAMTVDHKQFSLQRLTDVLDECVAEGVDSPRTVIDRILESVSEFTTGAIQSDDQTLLTIRYTPELKKALYHNSIVLTNNISEVARLNNFIKAVNADLLIESELGKQLQLSIEEAVVNVIDYAYGEEEKGNVEIDVEATSTELIFRVTDSGIFFAPTDVAKADTTLSVEERPIGGLGIFLVRSLMDKINYERVDGKNILTMWKQYKSDK